MSCSQEFSAFSTPFDLKQLQPKIQSETSCPRWIEPSHWQKWLGISVNPEITAANVITQGCKKAACRLSNGLCMIAASARLGGGQ
jgi:hypothetical protein